MEVQGTTTTAATATPPPIEINSGDSPISFDELDTMESAHKAAKRAQKNEVKDAAKETAKELAKAIDKKESKDSKAAKNEDGDAPKKDENEKAESKEAGKKAQQKDLETKATEKAVKKALKAKLADKDIEIDPETMVPHLIDGKEELVSIKELLSQNSGRVAYDKKFSEFNLERQKFMQRHDELNTKIRKIIDEKDPELRFFHMAEWSGQDPVQIREKFLNENMNLLEKWYAMSEDERKADAQAYENKILKYRLESKQREDSRRQSQATLQNKISDLGKTHKVSDDEFWSAYDMMKAAQEAGSFKEKISPESVISEIKKGRIWDKVAPILEASDLVEQKLKPTELRKFTENAHKLDMSLEEVLDAAETLWGKKAKAAVIEDKIKEQEEFRTGKKDKETKKVSTSDDPFFFSDLT